MSFNNFKPSLTGVTNLPVERTSIKDKSYKFNMKRFILTLTVAFISLSGFAQVKGNISGKLVDGGDKRVIASATVSLLKLKDSSIIKTDIVDGEGNFSFENIQAGTYFVTASSIGHLKTYSKGFVIDDSHTTEQLGVLQLKGEDKTLATVTVVSRKPFIERKLDKTIINVEASVSNAGNTTMEVLEKSPGVSVDKDGNISLKGKQGVIILIDGKQTYMGAQDLANYLQSMPASNLEQIELMPNPSSKYDASGNYGVINLKTKKNRVKGFNGSVSSTYGRGSYGRINNSLNLNYRNGKFNLFSAFSENHRRQNQTLLIHREYFTPAGSPDKIFDQKVDLLKTRNSNNAKIGVDFYATKNTTVGLVFSGYVNPGTQKTTNLAYLKDGTGNVVSILNSPSMQKEKWENISGNFNVRHSFDSTGREITADLDVLQYRNRQEQQFLSENYSPLWVKQSYDELSSVLPSKIKVHSAKVDYVQPFKKGLKMETGLKSSYVTTDNFAGYYNIIGGAAVQDNYKTNHFIYKENINAGYVNFSKEFKKWSLQAGLRAENTNYTGKQFGNPIHADSAFKNSYTGLFPTMFAGYKLNDKNEFGFSYGRRISRPDYEDLNPFIFFIDKYTYEAGNPFLKPMFANVFELTHTYNKFLTTTLNYTHNRDMFNEYFEQLGYATVVRQNNYGSINELSFALNAEIKPFKWWTMMPYAEINYNEVKSNVYGYDLQTKNTGFSANMNNQFRFKKGWGGELFAAK